MKSLNDVIERPVEVIESVFDDYLNSEGNTKENINKFDLPSLLISKQIIKSYDDPSFLDNIPIFIPGKTYKNEIIKFIGKVENVFENQFYALSKLNKKTNKYIINKYFDNDIICNNQNEDIFDNSNVVLGDRLRLNIGNIEELNNNILSKELGIVDSDKNSNNIKVYVYDYTNSHSKINKHYLIVGIANSNIADNSVVIHSWAMIDHYLDHIFENKIKDIDNLTEYGDNLIHKNLKDLLNNIFLGDSLISEYIILFLFSRTFSRIGSKNIGVLPLNLILSENSDSNSIYNNLSNILRSICASFKQISLNFDYLNKTPYYPKYNCETDELGKGELKLINGTFVLVNEMTMNEGKLCEVGVKNIETIKNLIDFQMLKYEYPYNNIEIFHDYCIATITKNCKSLFSSPFLTAIPMKSNEKENHNVNIDEKLIENIFYLINFIRNDKSFLDNFAISPEIGKKIQEDYMSKNKDKFNSDEFELVMKLSRMRALSLMRKEMTFEDYTFVCGLETERKERIKEYEERKKKK